MTALISGMVICSFIEEGAFKGCTNLKKVKINGHLPLLLKPEGNGKLSKRDGDRLGFPVFPLEWHDPKTGEISSGYRESGYLPEACD